MIRNMLARKKSRKKSIQIIKRAKKKSNKLDWFFGEMNWKKLLAKSIISMKFFFGNFASRLKNCLTNSIFIFLDGLSTTSLNILFLKFLKTNSKIATEIAPETRKNKVPWSPNEI